MLTRSIPQSGTGDQSVRRSTDPAIRQWPDLVTDGLTDDKIRHGGDDGHGKQRSAKTGASPACAPKPFGGRRPEGYGAQGGGPRHLLFTNGKIYATMTMMTDIREYHDRAGRSPFREWFDKLNSEASRKVTTALYRVGLGNFSNAKSVGAGVYECRIHFGPGYRVYFGKEDDVMVILLGGGTKRRQANDIRLAIERWEDYKRRKKDQKEGE
jgi:putative addiction module killer protein